MSNLKPGEIELDWTEADNGVPGEYSPVPAMVVFKDDDPHPETLCWLDYDREHADQWAEFVATACNAFKPLLEACKAVAKFRDCEDSADWKDAYIDLARRCCEAVRKATPAQQ